MPTTSFLFAPVRRFLLPPNSFTMFLLAIGESYVTLKSSSTVTISNAKKYVCFILSYIFKLFFIPHCLTVLSFLPSERINVFIINRLLIYLLNDITHYLCVLRVLFSYVQTRSYIDRSKSEVSKWIFMVSCAISGSTELVIAERRLNGSKAMSWVLAEIMSNSSTQSPTIHHGAIYELPALPPTLFSCKVSHQVRRKSVFIYAGQQHGTVCQKISSTYTLTTPFTLLSLAYHFRFYWLLYCSVLTCSHLVFIIGPAV